MKTLKKLYNLSNIFCGNIQVRKASNALPFTISVEGNIASGKTTLLNYFSQYSDINVIAEPVKKWQNLGGVNLFENYYNNPQRWSCVFQSYVQLTMLQNHHIHKDNTVVRILERSIHSARHIFVENLYKCGLMEKVEYLVLDEWYQWLLENEPISCDLIVYLRTDPDIIHSRIANRCRKEEKVIEKDFLISLHNLYEDWIAQLTKNQSNIIIIDGNPPINEMLSKYQYLYTTNVQPVIRINSNKSTNEKLEFKF